MYNISTSTCNEENFVTFDAFNGAYVWFRDNFIPFIKNLIST